MTEAPFIASPLWDPTLKLRAVKRVLWAILILNWLVAFAKIGYGFWSHTISMTADGFHSFFDGASNIVGLIAITVAIRPPDPSHPYGHRKFETLATMIISMFLFMAAYEILASAVHRLTHGDTDLPQVTPYSFIIMGATTLLNLGITVYERRAARKLSSQILMADSIHTLSDIYASCSVLVALVASKLHYPHMDIVAALFIVYLIARAAFSIVQQSLETLADASRVDPRKVEEIVMTIPGIKTCHQIRSRGIPDAICVDFHISLDSSLALEEAHRITHDAMNKVKMNIPGVTDVVIHTEPVHGPGHDD